MIAEMIVKIGKKDDLSYAEMSDAMNEMLNGRISPKETAEFLKNLTAKGESTNELMAMLDAMDMHAVHIEPKCGGRIIDVCGTGGDKMRTFNVSTTAAFVIAAGGVYVAKHGNRSSSGISGSADIFEFFGYDLNMNPIKVKEIIERFGIGFMFAQKFHPAMKNVAEARKMLGTRTAFNLLGPLCNPARVKSQLVGVATAEHLLQVASILQSRGAQNVMTVISGDGLDELSTTATNKVCHLKDGIITNFELDPAGLGMTKCKIEEIQISTKDEAIRSFISVLNNTGKKPMIDVTALNAAAGFIIGGLAERWDEALEISYGIIKSGKPFDLFRDLVKYCGNVSKLEELTKN